MKSNLIALIAFTLASCGGGDVNDTQDSETLAKSNTLTSVADEYAASEETPSTPNAHSLAAATPKATCIGDNDMLANSCFRGISLNQGYMYNWQYATGVGFYNNSARFTTYDSQDPAATWSFKTTAAGDIWFSV